MSLMKMTILAFNSFENPKDFIDPFVFMAMFNPGKYEVEYHFSKDRKETLGNDAQQAPIIAVSLQNMSFSFVIDGTGASLNQQDVLLEIRKFEKVVSPNPADSFQPPYGGSRSQGHLKLPKLLLLWGTFYFMCEIEEYSIEYSLFSQSGIPLRATINATFKEVVPGSNFKNLSDVLENNVILDKTLNVASFLSTAYSLSNNLSKSVEKARDENLNSLRDQVKN